jgi:hypothetical protein
MPCSSWQRVCRGGEVRRSVTAQAASASSCVGSFAVAILVEQVLSDKAPGCATSRVRAIVRGALSQSGPRRKVLCALQAEGGKNLEVHVAPLCLTKMEESGVPDAPLARWVWWGEE